MLPIASPIVSRPGQRRMLAVGMCALLVLAVDSAQAQRPIQVYDPFYRQESARRTFFDNIALTGEVMYGASSNASEIGLSSGLPLGLALRLDYQLTKRIDLSTIIDANAGRLGRTLSVSWVVLKYYDCAENRDCLAVRLAADPTSDGRVGFPQLDLALISTTYLTPYLSNDFAIGVRRVRMGYEQWRPREAADAGASVQGGVPQLEAFAAQSPSQFDVVYTRALGAELHLMMSTNVHLGPTGSGFHASLLAHAGQYELIESDVRATETADATTNADGLDAEAPTSTATDYRGGVLWARAGFSLSRPGYLLTPFIGFPLHQWIPDEDGWQTAQTQLGLRLMLR